MGEKLVATFQRELAKIKDIEIREGVEALLLGGHDEFLQWPASSSGKYHPPDEIGPMGMVIHVKRCVALAPDIARMYGLDAYGQDILIAASLVHDLYKQGKDGKAGHTVKDHMLIIHEVINMTVVDLNLDPSGKFFSELANACLFHEGVWTPPEAHELEDGPNIYATAMHTIDMMVTRRAIYDVMQSEWVTKALTSTWRLI